LTCGSPSSTFAFPYSAESTCPLLRKGAYPLVAEVFREESGQFGFAWNIVKLSIVVI